MIIKETIKGNVLYQHCICEVPTKYKIRIGKLLNQLMKDYGISGEEDNEKAFKDIFKSNLYWAIDDLMGDVRKEKKSQKKSEVKG